MTRATRLIVDMTFGAAIGLGSLAVNGNASLRTTMRTAAGAFAIAGALFTTSAFAQVDGADLNGRYQCVASCVGTPGGFAFVTQNGWELNMVNDVGQPSRAWVNYPGRIWVDRLQQGAIYSPDGMTIQFDGGTIWRRAVELPPAPPPRRRR